MTKKDFTLERVDFAEEEEDTEASDTTGQENTGN